MDVALLALPGHRELDRLACTEVLAAAQGLTGSFALRRHTLSCAADAWQLQDIATLPPRSIVVVFGPGSTRVPMPLDREVSRTLAQVARRQATLCAIGPSVLFFAERGLLNGLAVAALGEDVAALATHFPLVHWDARSAVVQDHQVVTSVGLLSAVHGALAVVGSCTTETVAQQLRERLGVRPIGADVAHRCASLARVLHPAVRRVSEVLQREPLHPWTSGDLARIACVSDRHLQRLFRTEMGCGVLEYLHRMRLERASSLLRSEPYSTLEQVAEASGFRSSQQMRRVWRKQHGEPPSAVRRSFA